MPQPDPFDSPPEGMRRGSRGWLIPNRNQEMVQRVMRENKELKAQLATLQATVEQVLAALTPQQPEEPTGE